MKLDHKLMVAGVAAAYLASGGSSAAQDLNRLPTNEVGPGFLQCRSYIHIRGKGQISYWSEIFETTKASEDFVAPWEAFMVAQFGGQGEIYSGSCLKFLNRSEAEKWMADPVVRDPVQTHWRAP